MAVVAKLKHKAGLAARWLRLRNESEVPLLCVLASDPAALVEVKSTTAGGVSLTGAKALRSVERVAVDRPATELVLAVGEERAVEVAVTKTFVSVYAVDRDARGACVVRGQLVNEYQTFAVTAAMARAPLPSDTAEAREAQLDRARATAAQEDAAAARAAAQEESCARAAAQERARTAEDDAAAARAAQQNALRRAEAAEAAAANSLVLNRMREDELRARAQRLQRALAIANRGVEQRVKVVLLGASGVGKSSLLDRFCGRAFEEHKTTTIGCDRAPNRRVSQFPHLAFDVFDMCGQERYRSVTELCFRNAQGFVVVYACDEEGGTVDWAHRLRTECPGVPFVLVANKADCEPRCVSEEQGRRLAAELGAVEYCETSAKTGVGVAELFGTLGAVLIDQHLTRDVPTDTVQLRRDDM